MSHRAEDIDAPEYLADMRWRAAFVAWLEWHDSAPLAGLIRTDGPMPEWVRDFLADLVQGKALRGPGGRPSERSGQHKRAILAAVFHAWEEAKTEPRGPQRLDEPKAAAVARVADNLKISGGAVKRILDDAQANGITLENWKKWGRPWLKKWGQPDETVT